MPDCPETEPEAPAQKERPCGGRKGGCHLTQPEGLTLSPQPGGRNDIQPEPGGPPVGENGGHGLIFPGVGGGGAPTNPGGKKGAALSPVGSTFPTGLLITN